MVKQYFYLSENKDPYDFKPEKTLSSFKEIYPVVGKYYGYLSEHSHWYPNTHGSALNFDNNELAVIYAAGRNKWESISNIFLLLLLHSRTYFTNYKKLNCNKGCRNLSRKIEKTHNDLCLLFKKWVKLFKKLDDPYISKEFINIMANEKTKIFWQ